MTIEELQEICQRFVAVTEDIKWEDHLCFNVGGKMFLITSPDSVLFSASFKLSKEEFEDIISREGFSKAPHLGRYYWVFVDDISRMGKKQWSETLSISYSLVAGKL